MSLALDTDLLIAWMVAAHPSHHAARALVARELDLPGTRVLLTPQVCWEYLHVVTDARRLSQPLAMDQAIQSLLELLDADEVESLQPDGGLIQRVLALMRQHQLGRKRILDTALAATLEQAGVRRLATLNGRDFQCFPFIEIVRPDAQDQEPPSP